MILPLLAASDSYEELETSNWDIVALVLGRLLLGDDILVITGSPALLFPVLDLLTDLNTLPYGDINTKRIIKWFHAIYMNKHIRWNLLC